MIADLRWFSPNRFGELVVPGLREAGYTIATSGPEPARAAIAMDAQLAVEAHEYSRRHRCPLVLYLWDLPPWRLGSGRPDAVFEWRGRIRRVPRIVGGYRERAGFYSRLHFIAGRAAAILVPSVQTMVDLRERFGLAAEPVAYCFDSSRFTRGEWIPRCPPRLFSVSRLVGHKNQAAIVRAAGRMTPRPTVHLLGQGPEAGPLRAMAAQLHVPLELPGEWAPDEAVVTGYRAATVVVAPSRFEGFGLTPLEGLAAGIPVVASDIPPHHEFAGAAAHYFALDDDLGLVTAIRSALERGPAPADLAARHIGALTIEAAVERFAARLTALGLVPAEAGLAR
jgi:glycosyltransferase involved in cell wall biosynthesis